jgi:hypothetical protein
MTTMTRAAIAEKPRSCALVDTAWPRAVVIGAVSGVAASMVMATFAMVASVIYQHHGVFTPLFHISALVGTPASMMISVRQAMAGHAFWFTFGPAVVGMVIHMTTGAMFGIGFALIARRTPRRAVVPVGALYGLGVFAFSSVVGLPVAAAITGAGDVIAEMPSTVGWATFAVEHVIFGITLGVIAPVLAAHTRR